MTAEMLAAIATLLGVLVTAALGIAKFKNERHKRVQAEQEVRFQRAALRFSDLVNEWGEISAMVTDAMENTRLDRFLILRAWNGRLDPRWTTAVHQIREVHQQHYTYAHIELDDDYVDRLRMIIRSGSARFVVDDMREPSLIKGFYSTEGVTDTLWFHLSNYKLDDSSAQAIEYCSFATHDPDGLDDATITACRLIVGRLKSLSISFSGEVARASL
ncbi:MAG: hypothetical protein Hals2KO_21430 [Halioglobus sp.]